MKHRLKKRKLSGGSSYRMSLMCNLAVSIIEHRRLRTTLVRARALRPFVEKLITKARVSDSLSVRRLLLSRIKNKSAVTRLVDEVAQRYVGRPGGYCRIIKAGYRAGDAAPMAIIEFV